jgi:5-methyltetrahydropteroyltriglutamate--homocysteine methyltransferase
MSTINSIRTTVIGSYPIPDWLKVAPTRGALRDAIMVVLKIQELAGIDVVADGELSRFDVNHPETDGMIDYFIRPMAGITTDLSRQQIEAFHKTEGMAYRIQPAGIITGGVGEGTLNLPRDYGFVRGLTEKPLKFTVTSPYMLGKVLLDQHYGNGSDAIMAIADVLRRQVEAIDAPVIQVDEANVTGHPYDGLFAAEAINVVLDGIRDERGVHLCFGNYGGQPVQKGLWKDLLPFMNALHCDHLLLEFARRGYGEVGVLRDLDPKIRVGVGVIDIKDNVVESPEEVARRIEDVVRIIGEERIAYVNPDCGFWMLPRSVADRKMQNLTKGRDLFYGKEI